MSRMFRKTSNGFTILELLIVIGIIAVIAGVVFFFVGRARAKGYDAKVQEVMSSTIRTSATDEFSDQGTFTNVCTTGKTYDAITALAQGINLVGSYGCAADANKYVVLFPLKAQSGYWCVDSLGQSGVVADNNAAISAKNCTGVVVADPGGGGGGGGGIPVGPTTPLSASAGGDQVIILPTNTTTLVGAAGGGSGTYSYTWSKVLGGAATITNSGSSNASLSGLVQGSYTFRLSVNDGLTTATDDVDITVNANAGTSYKPLTIPGTIQAEDFNTGGEGVAYHDTDPNNATGVYRPSEGVDLETTGDTSGAYNVGWINDNEWLKYTANVTEAGIYTVSARVASPTGGGAIRVEIDGGSGSTITVPQTNGWQTWQTVTGPGISLSQGTHVIRLYIQSGNFNLNYVTFTKVSTPTGDYPAARTLDIRGPVLMSQMGPYATYSFYESLPRGYYNDPNKKWPLLIMMHGAGENPPQPISALLRNGPLYWVSQGDQLEFNVGGKTETFVIIEPQSDWWHPFLVDGFIEYAKSNYKIDPTRIYVTGLSMGSQGSLTYAAFSPDYTGDAYARKTAAIAPVDGVFGSISDSIYTPNDPDGAAVNYCYIASTFLPTWLFSSEGHNPQWMTDMKNRLNACNPPPNPPLKYTYYPNDTGAWTKAYDPSHTYENPNLYEWLLSQHR